MLRRLHWHYCFQLILQRVIIQTRVALFIKKLLIKRLSHLLSIVASASCQQSRTQELQPSRGSAARAATSAHSLRGAIIDLASLLFFYVYILDSAMEIPKVQLRHEASASTLLFDKSENDEVTAYEYMAKANSFARFSFYLATIIVSALCLLMVASLGEQRAKEGLF